MSVGCGLRWRARGVSALHRSQPPTLLDDVCSPAPRSPRLAPARVSAPTDCIYHPPPRHTHTYSTIYLSAATAAAHRAAVCSHRQHLHVLAKCVLYFTDDYFSKLKYRYKVPAPVYSNLFILQFGCKVLIRRSYQPRCSIAKGAIKAVYISSRATCKCYFVLIKTELRYKIYVRTL